MDSFYISVNPVQTLLKQQCHTIQIPYALISTLQKKTLLHLSNLVGAQNEVNAVSKNDPDCPFVQAFGQALSEFLMRKLHTNDLPLY